MTSTSVTGDSEEAILVSSKELERVTYIQYPIAFQDNETQDGSALNYVLAFFDSGSEVNTMYLIFTKRLGLVVQSINVAAQKIDSTTFETYEMVVAAFSMIDQANKVRFKETFLVANISSDVVLGMPFLILSDTDVHFPKREL